MYKTFPRSHPANACGHFLKGNACDRRRRRKKGARVGAAVGDRRGGVSADDGAGHRKRKPRSCFHKDQEGRRSSPVGCCVVGNPIKGFPDAARHAAFVQLAIGKPVFRQAEAPDFYPEPARVDKVDTLLDGDAGSRRLVILALLPLSPPVPPLLLKNSGNTCVSTIFRL